MAFKRSELKNWIVTRTVTLFGESTVEVDIRVLPQSAGEAIVAKNSDVETVKGYVNAMREYQDESGKELGLKGFVKHCEEGALPPTCAAAVATIAIQAQWDAAIKN